MVCHTLLVLWVFESVSATSDFHSEVPNERIKTTAAMSLYNSHSTLNTITRKNTVLIEIYQFARVAKMVLLQM